MIIKYGKEKKEISIWLDQTEEKELKAFHCVVCGKIVFEYYSPVSIIMPGDMRNIMKTPIIIHCHGTKTVYNKYDTIHTKCIAKYIIEG